jgi:hypothetical protein
MQALRPSHDLLLGGWAAAPLWEKISDDGNASWITSSNNSAEDTCRVRLEEGVEPQEGSRLLIYSFRKSASGGQAIDVRVRLVVASTGAVLESWLHSNVSNTFQTATQGVTAVISDTSTRFASSGTGYGDLALEFARIGPTGGPAGNRRSAEIGFARLEIPGAKGAAPATPGGFTATPDVGQVQLDWNPVADAEGYRIYGDGNPMPVYDGGETSHLDGNLTNGQPYSYQVSAYNAYSESPLSGAVTATPGDYEAPSVWIDEPEEGAVIYLVREKGGPVPPERQRSGV